MSKRVLRRLDISMYDTLFVNCSKCYEKRLEIYLDITNIHIPVVCLTFFSVAPFSRSWLESTHPKILMSEMRENSDDLILVAESSDEWTYRG